MLLALFFSPDLCKAIFRSFSLAESGSGSLRMDMTLPQIAKVLSAQQIQSQLQRFLLILLIALPARIHFLCEGSRYLFSNLIGFKLKHFLNDAVHVVLAFEIDTQRFVVEIGHPILEALINNHAEMFASVYSIGGIFAYYFF